MATPKIDPETMKQMMSIVGQSMGGLTPNARVASTPIPMGLEAKTAQATHDGVMGSVADNQRKQQMQIEQQNAKDMLSMRERQLAIDSANTMFEHGMQTKQLDATVEGNNLDREAKASQFNASMLSDEAKLNASIKDNQADRTSREGMADAQNETSLATAKINSANAVTRLNPNITRSDTRVKDFRKYVTDGEKAMRDMSSEVTELMKQESDPAVKQAMQAYLGNKSTSGGSSGLDPKDMSARAASIASFNAGKEKPKKQSTVNNGYNPAYGGTN